MWIHKKWAEARYGNSSLRRCAWKCSICVIWSHNGTKKICKYGVSHTVTRAQMHSVKILDFNYPKCDLCLTWVWNRLDPVGSLRVFVCVWEKKREKHREGEEEREHVSPATSCPAGALLLVVPAVGGRGCGGGSRGIRHANIPVRPGSSPGGHRWITVIWFKQSVCTCVSRPLCECRDGALHLPPL